MLVPFKEGIPIDSGPRFLLPRWFKKPLLTIIFNLTDYILNPESKT